MRVFDLLSEIPADTLEVVSRACDAWNLRIRRQITDQFLRFGLQYHRGERNLNATLTTMWDKVGQPIRFALPDEVAEREIPGGFELAARLSVHAPAARALGGSATDLLRLFEPSREGIWQRTQISPGMARGTLQGAQSLAEELQRLATPLLQPDSKGRFDLVKFLLEVDEDILGQYEYDGRDTGDAPSPNGVVVVFWGVVGLVASSLGVGSGQLAVAVLAHEFAHGYSHLGHDRDGRRWAGRDFMESERRLKEAIAQYYTHLVVEALDGSYPGVLDAYENLLPKQPKPYHGHLRWLLGSSPERVASVLADARHDRAGYEEVTGQLRITGVSREISVEDALTELRRRRRGER